MATTAPAVPSGPAHVAVVSFLAARAAPTGGFWVALAGGVALARVAQRSGARLGFGASIAAMLETVAIMGPARFGVPLTQAATAPMLGRLEARGWAVLWQILACGVLRLAAQHRHHGVLHLGDRRRPRRLRRHLRRDRPPLGPQVGSADTLVLTAAGLVGLERPSQRPCRWASTGAAWRGWDARPRTRRRGPNHRRDRSAPQRRRRFDPRAVALAAAVAFGLLLASHRRGGCSERSRRWLVARGWLSRPGPRRPCPPGCSSPPSSPAARSSSPWAGASAWRRRCSARAARRAAGARGHVAARRPPARRGCARSARRALGVCALPSVPEAARTLDRSAPRAGWRRRPRTARSR